MRDSWKLGLALADEGRWSEAIAAYERALAEHPGDPAILFALGRAALALGSLDAAIGFFARVLAHDPDRIEALVKLCEAYAATARHAEAIELLQSTLPRHQEEAVLWLTLGNVVQEMGDTANAETFFREAIRLKPRSAEALGNLADLLWDRGDSNEARALYEKAIKIAPQNAQLHLNHALLLLAAGEFDAGWREYEWRLRIPARALARNHGLKRWSGQRRNGKRLLVVSEQGLGDQILFASCLPDLLGDGPILVECEPRLVPLFARSFPDASVRAHHLRAEASRKTMDYAWLREDGGADLFIEIASLPLYLRAARADFPNPHAYLAPDGEERARWTEWLGRLGPRPKIGLCWRSGKTAGLRAAQYAPLEAWAAFMASLDVEMVCAQYGATSEEIARLEAQSGKTLHLPPGLDQREEIDRAAALLSALDAIVTAPTAVASLAAGLGVPTFKLLYDKSWTSFGEEIEPLAPSCCCLKPARPGDWPEVFARARERVSRLSPPRSPS